MTTNVAYGVHAVRVLLERSPDRVRRLWIQGGKAGERLEELRRLAQQHRIDAATADAALLDRLADNGRHQGIVAELAARASDPETALEVALEAAVGPPLLLILDGVQDPHNLGACLRTADAAHVTAVIAPRDRASGLTPVVRKVAAGAAESVPFIAVVNLARKLKINAEVALGSATRKFVARFEAMQALAEARDLPFTKLTLAEMDALWDEVKMAGARKVE